MKKYLPLFLCLFIIGCASTQVISNEEIWKTPEVYAFIEKYVEEYGVPSIIMHGMNLENGDEYLDMYWKIEEHWYKVQIYKGSEGWAVLEDQIAKSRI